MALWTGGAHWPTLAIDRIRQINEAFVAKPAFSADLAVFLKNAVKYVCPAPWGKQAPEAERISVVPYL